MIPISCTCYTTIAFCVFVCVSVYTEGGPRELNLELAYRCVNILICKIKFTSLVYVLLTCLYMWLSHKLHVFLIKSALWWFCCHHLWRSQSESRNYSPPLFQREITISHTELSFVLYKKCNFFWINNNINKHFKITNINLTPFLSNIDVNRLHCWNGTNNNTA